MSQDRVNIAGAVRAEGAEPRRPAVRTELLTLDEVNADETLLPAWRELGGALVEESPFYAPWTLAPALAAYADKSVRIVCVWRGDVLIGLLPVSKARGFARLPVPHWRSWTHPHCFFAAPLVRVGEEDAFFRALFSTLCEGPHARGFVRLGRLDRDGPLFRAALAAAQKTGRIAYDSGETERAMLCAGASAEATLAVFVRKKKRKELKRLRNRLDELGRVEVREFSPTDEMTQWADLFLALEHRGWKGENGTSLKASDADANWFRQTLQGASDAGKLHFIRIDINGRPIAMLASLLSKGAGYSVKICHDPDYARYSPGVMVEIEAMRSVLEREDFRFMDSCAAPDHSMINGLWRSRRVVTGLNVSGKGLFARAGLSLCRALEGVRARLPVGKV